MGIDLGQTVHEANVYSTKFAVLEFCSSHLLTTEKTFLKASI